MEPFFLALGASIGAVFVFVFARSAIRGMQQRRWLVVSGRVTRAFVEETRGVDTSRDFAACIHYEYLYGDRNLVGREYIGTSAMGKVNAQEIVARYPSGLVLPVYLYAPDPTESKLTPGANGGAIAAVFFGGACMALAAYRASQLL